MRREVKPLFIVTLVYSTVDLLFFRRYPISGGFIFAYLLGWVLIWGGGFVYHNIITERHFTPYFTVVALWLPVIIMGYRIDVATQSQWSVYNYVFLLASSHMEGERLSEELIMNTVVIPGLISTSLFLLVGIYRFLYKLVKDEEVLPEDYTKPANLAVFIPLLLVGYSPISLFPFLFSDPLISDLPCGFLRILKKKETSES